MNQVADACNKRLQEGKPWEAPASPASRRLLLSCARALRGHRGDALAGDAGLRRRPGGGLRRRPALATWAAGLRPVRGAAGAWRGRSRRRSPGSTPSRWRSSSPRPPAEAAARSPRRASPAETATKASARPPAGAAALRDHRLRRLRQGGAPGGARPRRRAGAQGRQAPPAHGRRRRAGAAHHRGRDRRRPTRSRRCWSGSASSWWPTSTPRALRGITSQGMLLAAGEPPARWSGGRGRRPRAPGSSERWSTPTPTSTSRTSRATSTAVVARAAAGRRGADRRDRALARAGRLRQRARAGPAPARRSSPPPSASTRTSAPGCPEADWAESARAGRATRAVVAVGETGLDFHYDLSPREVQEESFRRSIRIARAVGKPLVIHVREADADCAAGPARGGAAGGGRRDPLLHRRLRRRPGPTSTSGSTSRWPASSPSRRPRRSARPSGCVPHDRLLVETDSPFLAPVPFRGKRNEPAHVRPRGGEGGRGVGQ